MKKKILNCNEQDWRALCRAHETCKKCPAYTREQSSGYNCAVRVAIGYYDMLCKVIEIPKMVKRPGDEKEN